jgi:hypothetical protein
VLLFTAADADVDGTTAPGAEAVGEVDKDAGADRDAVGVPAAGADGADAFAVGVVVPAASGELLPFRSKPA